MLPGVCIEPTALAEGMCDQHVADSRSPNTTCLPRAASMPHNTGINSDVSRGFHWAAQHATPGGKEVAHVACRTEIPLGTIAGPGEFRRIKDCQRAALSGQRSALMPMSLRYGNES